MSWGGNVGESHCHTQVPTKQLRTFTTDSGLKALLIMSEISTLMAASRLNYRMTTTQTSTAISLNVTTDFIDL